MISLLRKDELLYLKDSPGLAKKEQKQFLNKCGC